MDIDALREARRSQRMTETRRVPLTVRLAPADKDAFETAATRCGLEAGIAARLLMEAAVRRIAAGVDFLDVLQELRNAGTAQEIRNAVSASSR